MNLKNLIFAFLLIVSLAFLYILWRCKRLHKSNRLLKKELDNQFKIRLTMLGDIHTLIEKPGSPEGIGVRTVYIIQKQQLNQVWQGSDPPDLEKLKGLFDQHVDNYKTVQNETGRSKD